MISLGPLSPSRELPALLAASAVQFGAEGYQHLPRYLDWLYTAGPYARGMADCLVARQDGAVVGAIHRMVLPLRGGDGLGTLGVLHNHFVAEAVRSGAGVLLLRRAIKDVEIGLAPGVQAPLDEVYRRLGFVEHRASWLIKPLAPLAAGAQLARGRLMRRAPMRVDLARAGRAAPDLVVSARPDDAMLQHLVQAMRGADPAAMGVDWTPALVRWRFFHPIGPRHLLLATPDGAAVAVVALGIRRGMTVARLVELEGRADAGFLACVERVMRAAGATIGMAFTTSDTATTLLTARGWRVRGAGTHSFRTGTAPLAIGGGGTDVGFESFTTEFLR